MVLLLHSGRILPLLLPENGNKLHGCDYDGRWNCNYQLLYSDKEVPAAVLFLPVLLYLVLY